jgi:hypothetical protein
MLRNPKSATSTVQSCADPALQELPGQATAAGLGQSPAPQQPPHTQSGRTPDALNGFYLVFNGFTGYVVKTGKKGF